MKQIEILRKLAQEYYEQAMTVVNLERMALHRAVNDLHMLRPVVLIDEIPFHELNQNGFLTLQCTDPILREAEDFLRKKLFQWKYFPADMILPPFVPVYKIMHNSGIGIDIKENRLSADPDAEISSHEYYDQLSCPEDLERIKLPVITYDSKTTMENYAKVAEAIGDIIAQFEGKCNSCCLHARTMIEFL